MIPLRLAAGKGLSAWLPGETLLEPGLTNMISVIVR
jgi:hypothetical protein